MCQAYEAEKNFLLWMEERIREKGYSAHKSGILINNCPEEYFLKGDKEQWELGWKTAEAGRELW